MKKGVLTTIVVVAVIFVVCIVCIVGVFFVFGMGMDAIMQEGSVIRDDVLVDLCESRGDYTQIEYERWFTDSFMADYSLEEAQEASLEAFPITFECGTILPDSFWELIKTGQGIDVSISPDKYTAEFSYMPGDNSVSMQNTVYLEKIGNEWKVTSL